MFFLGKSRVSASGVQLKLYPDSYAISPVVKSYVFLFKSGNAVGEKKEGIKKKKMESGIVCINQE